MGIIKFLTFQLKEISRVALILLFAAITPPHVSSQVLPFHTYTTREGLPSNHVTALCQDSKGFLWIGTDEGLCVYDGETFKTFTTIDGLVNPYVTSIIESHKSPGTMWIASIADGVTRFKDGVFTEFRFPSGSSRIFAGTIVEDQQGTIWSVTSSGEFRIAGDTLQPFPIHPPEYISGNDVVVASDGRICFGVNRRIYIYSPVEHTTNTTNLDLQPNASINAMMVDREGDIWISAQDSTLRRFVGEKLLATWHSGSYGLVNRLVLDRDGDLWLTTTNGLLRIPKKAFPDGRFTTYTRTNGLPESVIDPILEDREGDIWFGGTSSGLNKLSEKNVVKLPLNNNGAACADRAGHLWLQNSPGIWECWKDKNGVWSTVDHRLSRDRRPVGLPAIRSDHRGRLWFQYADSTLECDTIISHESGPSTLQKLFTLESGKHFPSALLWMFYVDPQDYVWLSMGNGIGVIDLNAAQPKFLTILRQDDELRMSSVRVIYRDSKSNVWFGSFSDGLAELVGGDLTRRELKHFRTTDGLPDNGVRALSEDDQGRLWIGTRFGGLAIYDGSKFKTISIKDGLPSYVVWAIARDERHQMWLGTGAGALSVNADNLGELRLSELTTRDPCTVMYSEPTKTVWLVLAGEAVALEEEAREAISPPVYISEISVNDRPIEIRNGMEFPHYQNNIIIQYIGLSFRDEKAVRYQYRFQGIDSGWSSPLHQRSVTYAALSPGSYTFEVIAMNGDGVKSSVPASFSFTIVAPLWQRWWFRSIAAVLFLSIGPFVYYRRVSRLKREKQIQQEFSRRLIESQESERTRIAAELHDSLGQNLLVIQNHAILALDASSAQPEVRDRLNDISSITTQTITDVREIALNLRPYHLDKLGLTTSINSIIRRMSESSKTLFTSDIDPIDGLFSKEEESHIYRIIQEGMNNIVKHSQANEAIVSIKKGEAEVLVTIRDNGKGFEKARTTIPKPDDAMHGFGLIGLGERVRILNGNLNFTSTPGQGTLLLVGIPFRRDRHA